MNRRGFIRSAAAAVAMAWSPLAIRREVVEEVAEEIVCAYPHCEAAMRELWDELLRACIRSSPRGISETPVALTPPTE